MKNKLRLIIIILIMYTVRYVKSIRELNPFVSSKEVGISSVAAKIVDSCFKGKTKNTILIDRNQSDLVIFKSLLAKSIIPMTIFEIYDNRIFINNKRFLIPNNLTKIHVRKKNYPVTSMIIATSSASILTTTLKHTRDSVWWNHAALYLIVNNDSPNSCQEATKFLDIVWSFSILSAIYLCKNKTQLSLYSFNPYTDLAPMLWQKVTYSSENKQLTFFYYPVSNSDEIFLSNDASLCKALYYDKAKNLGYYNLKVALFHDPIGFPYDKTRTGYKRFSGYAFKSMSTILSEMNATITVKITKIVGYVDKHGKFHGAVKDALSKTADLLMNTFLIRNYWSAQAYPYSTSIINVLCLKESERFIHKFQLNFDLTCWIFFIITCFTLIILLKYILKQTVTFTILEFTHLLLYGQFIHEPRSRTFPKKLGLIILATFMMNIFIQSQLSASKIVTDQGPLINTLDDLIKSNLTIYGVQSHKELISNEEIRTRFKVSKTFAECVIRLYKGQRIGCLIPRNIRRIYLFKNNNIYTLKFNLLERSNTFIISRDSPILYKINWFLSIMTETGLINYIEKTEKRYFLKNYTDDTDVNNSNFEKLTFSFHVLIGGSVLALVVLFLEVIINLKE